MADGRDPTPAHRLRTAYPWLEIFRCFQIALDPRKLLVAAAGILVMSFFWWLLSNIFYYKAPLRTDAEYSNETIMHKYGDRIKDEAEAKRIGNEQWAADYKQWEVLDSLAGPEGRLRTLPWYEYRGPNPFFLITDLLTGTAAERASAFEHFWNGTVPVLVEPLVKLLLPVVKIISPGVSAQTRFYLLLVLLVNIAVWAFCAGVITRLAAVQLANKGPISLRQAIVFVNNRYPSYFGAPAVPLAIIAAAIIGLIIYGLISLIPFIGDVILIGLGLPLIIIGGAVMAVFLVGLTGYPLMYTTLSVEGDQSDTFDALSRSINYVYQSPWSYIWYWLVAIVYGAIVTLFVIFFTSLTVYVGKWAVGLPASWVWSDRKPEFLFLYAPESFGWRELLTKDSPYAIQGQWELPPGADGVGVPSPAVNQPSAAATRLVYAYHPAHPAEYAQARSEFYAYNKWGAGLVCFWLTLIFLLMLGFAYSFFWSAAVMIYLLMRKRVDEAELDEVFLEEEEPVAPPAPPKIAEGTTPTSLPVLSGPVPAPHPPAAPLPPIPLADVPSTAPPAATIPFSPPPITITESPKHIDEPPGDAPKPPLV